MSVEDTLVERGKRYGRFADNALVSQLLKQALAHGNQWSNMPDYQKEACEQICVKLSRVVSCDFKYIDNWEDIAGYATLVKGELEEEILREEIPF